MTVACFDPPASVTEFNEGDFERAGYEAHDQLGAASPENLTFARLLADDEVGVLREMRVEDLA